MNTIFRRHVFLILIFFVIVFDQSVKVWAYYSLKPNMIYEPKYVGKIISFLYSTNSGFACCIFSQLKYRRLIAFILRIVLLFLILRNFRRRKSRKLVDKISTGLIFGGGMSNTLDWIFYGVIFNNVSNDAPFKLFYGNVVDMLYFSFLSGDVIFVFNIADLCVFLGIILCLCVKFNEFCIDDCKIGKR